MPSATIVFIDNGLQSQNQDYFPNRFELQRSYVIKAIEKINLVSLEELVGIIPLFQEVKHDIITPIQSNSTKLSHYLGKLDLSKNNNLKDVFYQASKAFSWIELSSKNLVIFLSSEVIDPFSVISDLVGLVEEQLELKIICFADAIKFAEIIKKEFPDLNKSVITIQQYEDFEEKVGNFIFPNNNDTYDEDEENMRIAMERSMLEK